MLESVVVRPSKENHKMVMNVMTVHEYFIWGLFQTPVSLSQDLGVYCI